MPDKPRLADQFRFGKRKPRALTTQDGTTIAQDEAKPVIVYGEPLRIVGEPIAMDPRPRSDIRVVTFDGAVQPRERDR